MHREAGPDQLNEDLLRLTRICVAVAADSLAGDEGNLSLQQYRALASLASQEGQRPVDLARTLGVSPSTTTTLCDRLVAKGLLSRRRRGGDRRSILLFVTARGLEQLETISSRRSALLREIVVRLPSAVQRQFAELLPAFIEAADELGIDEWSIRGLVANRATAADWVQ